MNARRMHMKVSTSKQRVIFRPLEKTRYTGELTMSFRLTDTTKYHTRVQRKEVMPIKNK